MTVSLPAIYASFLRLSATLTENETYAIAIEEACKLVSAQYGTIFIADEHKRLKRVYSTSPKEFQFEPRPKGYCYNCFVKKKPIVVPASKIRSAHPEFASADAKLVVMIPLSFEGEAFGVLTLDSLNEKRFSRRRLHIIQLFGSLVSIKIRNSALIARMKSALETRDLFISMASHELKTPLTTISAYAQLIEKKMENNEPVKSDWSKTMVLATNRMTRLINDLLQINQIRTGNLPYHFRICSLKKIIDTSVADFKVGHSQSQLILKGDIDETMEVFADAQRMNQVFSNLLNNSAKFSPADKPIFLEIGKKNNKIAISFTDQGQGISKEDRQRLFEEFFKVKANTKEGLGLGLYISKQIVEKHKGTIQVKSKLGIGTTVTIFLPQIHYG